MNLAAALLPVWPTLACAMLGVTGCGGGDTSPGRDAQIESSSSSDGPGCAGELEFPSVTPVEPCAGDPTGHWVMTGFDWPSMPIRFRYYLSDSVTEVEGSTLQFREGYCTGEVIEVRLSLDVQFTIDDQGAMAVTANPLDVRARHLDSCSIPVFADEAEMNDGSCVQFEQCTLDCGVCTCSYFNEGSYTYASLDAQESKIHWDLWGPDDELSYCIEGESMRLSSSRGLSMQMERR